MTGTLHSLIDRLALRLTRPLPDGARRLGLYRIVYAAFYLWFLGPNPTVWVAGAPKAITHKLWLIHVLPDVPAAGLAALEALLVFALILVGFGCYTRATTVVTLVVGGFLEGLRYRLEMEHGPILLTVYIPMCIVVSGCRWGDACSVDAAWGRRQPHPDSGQYAMPIRMVFAIWALLMTTSGVFKLIDGVWLTRTDFLANLVLERNVKAALFGLPLNPIAPWLGHHVGWAFAVQVFVAVFEATFLIAIIGPRAARFYVGAALVFHGLNALFLVVTFTSILAAYLMFVDWPSVVPKAWSNRLGRRLGSPAIAWSVASGATLAWLFLPSTRHLLSAGGLLDWRSLWYFVVPLALWTMVDVLRRTLRR